MLTADMNRLEKPTSIPSHRSGTWVETNARTLSPYSGSSGDGADRSISASATGKLLKLILS